MKSAGTGKRPSSPGASSGSAYILNRDRTNGKGAKMEIRPMFVVGIMLLGSAAAQQPAAPKNPPASPAKAQPAAPAKAQPTPAAKLPDAPKSQGGAAFATPKAKASYALGMYF